MWSVGKLSHSPRFLGALSSQMTPIRFHSTEMYHPPFDDRPRMARFCCLPVAVLGPRTLSAWLS